MKKLSYLFGALAVLLSQVMCAVVAYGYCDMLWGIRYACYSAPASVAANSPNHTARGGVQRACSACHSTTWQ